MTSLALSGGVYGATRSLPMSAGCFLGGFLIDADHYFDYLFIERQWRRWSPQAFLRYYFETRFSRVVLPLHSWESLSILIVISALYGSPLLVGYVVGALMHLIFDVLINGEHALREPVKFYSFAYRWSLGFRTFSLLHPQSQLSDSSLNSQFWRVRHPHLSTTDSAATGAAVRGSRKVWLSGDRLP